MTHLQADDWGITVGEGTPHAGDECGHLAAHAKLLEEALVRRPVPAKTRSAVVRGGARWCAVGTGWWRGDDRAVLAGRNA
mgnify:CR=1 FL=1